jgi:hypothetical protein
MVCSRASHLCIGLTSWTLAERNTSFQGFWLCSKLIYRSDNTRLDVKDRALCFVPPVLVAHVLCCACRCITFAAAEIYSLLLHGLQQSFALRCALVWIDLGGIELFGVSFWRWSVALSSFTCTWAAAVFGSSRKSSWRKACQPALLWYFLYQEWSKN